jgi:hypothetical protein
MMNEPKAAFIMTGRANQSISSVMREKPATMPVRHPELLDLILTPFLFYDCTLLCCFRRVSDPPEAAAL